MTTEQELNVNRDLAAQWFLRGEGIEIGALHKPLLMPPAARVTYVDRMSAEGLRTHYPELKDLPLVDPEIIDDGETLSRMEAASQDFVVACHFFEHCQNPVITLRNFVRVLKPDGVLFLVVPDKLYTFDKERPSTTIEHIVRDFEEGPAWSREDHYREYARLVDHAPAGEVETARVQLLMDMDYSIHFHVWTKGEMLELLYALKDKYAFGYEVRFFLDNGIEGIYILQKVTEPGNPVRLMGNGTVPGQVTPEDARGPFWSRRA